MAMLMVLYRDRAREMAASLLTFSLLAVPLVSLYGIRQYLDPAPWDIYWMFNADLRSIGLPEAFKVRVFSTMNSRDRSRAFLVVAIALLCAGRSPLRWIAVALGLAALGLTLSRTSWLGLGSCSELRSCWVRFASSGRSPCFLARCP